jgi:hypothetical protein
MKITKKKKKLFKPQEGQTYLIQKKKQKKQKKKNSSAIRVGSCAMPWLLKNNSKSYSYDSLASFVPGHSVSCE